MYIIKHSNEVQFYSTIQAMLVRGLGFTADADTLTVILTGGY